MSDEDQDLTQTQRIAVNRERISGIQRELTEYKVETNKKMDEAKESRTIIHTKIDGVNADISKLSIKQEALSISSISNGKKLDEIKDDKKQQRNAVINWIIGILSPIIVALLLVWLMGK